MTAIIEKLRSFPDLVTLKPAPESEITKAESQLSLKFAADYKKYTAEFGAAAANGHELTGVVSSKRLNVITATKREREINSKIPQTLYVVENTGIDGIIIWQDESGSVFQSMPYAQPRKIASSLIEYFDKY